MASTVALQNVYTDAVEYIDLAAGEITTIDECDFVKVYANGLQGHAFNYRLSEESPWIPLGILIESELLVGTGPVQVRSDKPARCKVTSYTYTSSQDAYGHTAEEGGAAAFTELTDVPATIVPGAALRGSRTGAGLEFSPTVAPFNVSAAHLNHDTNLMVETLDCVDASTFSFSFWVNYRNAQGNRCVYIGDPDEQGNTFLKFTEAGNLVIGFGDTDGENYFEVAALAVLRLNEYMHIMGSFKLDHITGAKVAVVYINDQQVDLIVNYDDDSMDIAMDGLPFAIGRQPSGGQPQFTLGEFWLALGQSLLVDGDIPEVNRRKFIGADGWPVNLGAAGATPTGTSPTIFCRVPFGGTPGDFLTNLGLGGGPFVYEGEGELKAAYPCYPSLPPPDFLNPMMERNDIVVGGIYGGANRLNAPSNTGTFVLKCVNGAMQWVEEV